VYKVVRCIVQYGVSCRTVYRTVRCIVPCGGSYYYSLLTATAVRAMSVNDDG